VVSTIVYIAMGWLVVIAVRPLFRAVPIGGLAWLLAGGLATRSVWLSLARRACDSTMRCGTCSCSGAALAITLRSCAMSCHTATYEASFRFCLARVPQRFAVTALPRQSQVSFTDQAALI